MNATASASSVRCCVFDAYGTLFDFSRMPEACVEALGERAEAFNALWRTKQIEYTWQVSLRGDYVDFETITGRSLAYAMAAFGIDDARLRTTLMTSFLSPVAFPDTRTTLGALKASGRPTAILSNGSPAMLKTAVDAAGIADLLDAVLSVDAVRIYKPHPRVYRLAVERFAVEPSDVCFVSSNAWDVAGAAHFGFRVAWVNRRNLIPEELPGRPDWEVAALADIPPLLAG